MSSWLKALVVVGLAALFLPLVGLLEEFGWNSAVDITIVVTLAVLIGALARGWWILWIAVALVGVGFAIDLAGPCWPASEPDAECEGPLGTFLALYLVAPIALAALLTGVLLGKAIEWLSRRGRPADSQT